MQIYVFFSSFGCQQPHDEFNLGQIDFIHFCSFFFIWNQWIFRSRYLGCSFDCAQQFLWFLCFKRDIKKNGRHYGKMNKYFFWETRNLIYPNLYHLMILYTAFIFLCPWPQDKFYISLWQKKNKIILWNCWNILEQTWLECSSFYRSSYVWFLFQ